MKHLQVKAQLLTVSAGLVVSGIASAGLCDVTCESCSGVSPTDPTWLAAAVAEAQKYNLPVHATIRVCKDLTPIFRDGRWEDPSDTNTYTVATAPVTGSANLTASSSPGHDDIKCIPPSPSSPVTGVIHLKYKILGVDYAPPGAHSNVTYNANMLRGSSTDTSQAYKNDVSVSTSVGGGGSFFGIFGGKNTTTASTSYSQQTDTSTSISISTTATIIDTIPGPLSSAVGVDHDYDIVWVWVNPSLELSLNTSTSIQWNGYAYDAEDDSNEMEVIPLYVSYLKNPASIPSNIAVRLARSWDTTGLGGLTSADYATILTADPFASGSYNPNTDTGHRFDIQGGQTFSYTPPPAGGQPITQSYSVASQTTSTQGQGAQHSYSAGYSYDANYSVNFFGELSADLKVADTFTSTSTWSSKVMSGTGQTASLSIVGPASSDNYTGPTQFQVWRDNVYGSFMFYPVK